MGEQTDGYLITQKFSHDTIDKANKKWQDRDFDTGMFLPGDRVRVRCGKDPCKRCNRNEEDEPVLTPKAYKAAKLHCSKCNSKGFTRQSKSKYPSCTVVLPTREEERKEKKRHRGMKDGGRRQTLLVQFESGTRRWTRTKWFYKNDEDIAASPQAAGSPRDASARRPHLVKLLAEAEEKWISASSEEFKDEFGVENLRIDSFDERVDATVKFCKQKKKPRDMLDHEPNENIFSLDKFVLGQPLPRTDIARKAEDEADEKRREQLKHERRKAMYSKATPNVKKRKYPMRSEANTLGENVMQDLWMGFQEGADYVQSAQTESDNTPLLTLQEIEETEEQIKKEKES